MSKDIITLDNLLEEIQEIREMALGEGDYKTALTCTMSKAKLLGIDKGEGVETLQANIIEHEPKMVYSDEQLKRVLLEIDKQLEEEY